MYVGGTVGCALLLYGPFILFCAVAFLRYPQLVLVALSSAMSTCISTLVVAVLFSFFNVFAASGAEVGAAALGAVVVVQAALQILVRNATALAWLHVQFNMRAKAGQVLLWSNYRFVPVTATIGLGTAFIAVVLSGGLQLEAEYTYTVKGGMGTGKYATSAYNLSVCPQLPIVAHVSLQAALLTISHVAWGVMAGQAVCALWTYGVPRYTREIVERLCGERLHSSHEVHDGDRGEVALGESREGVRDTSAAPFPVNNGVEHSAKCNATGMVDSSTRRGLSIVTDGYHEEPLNRATCHPIPREEAEIHSDAEESVDNVDNCEAAVARSTCEETSKAQRQDTQLLAFLAPEPTPQTQRLRLSNPVPYKGRCDTVLVMYPDYALGTLVGSIALHLAFACLSLVHTSAFNYTMMYEVAQRGCVVSLPLQLVLTTASVLWALWIVRLEQVGRV